MHQINVILLLQTYLCDTISVHNKKEIFFQQKCQFIASSGQNFHFSIHFLHTTYDRYSLCVRNDMILRDVNNFNPLNLLQLLTIL